MTSIGVKEVGHARRAGESRAKGRAAASVAAAAQVAVPTVALFEHEDVTGELAVKLRYGTVGDLLYVCETWAQTDECTLYRSDTPEIDSDDVREVTIDGKGWRSARFMPRAKARIILRIEDVRCERLQAISEADAEAEGALHFPSIPTNSPYKSAPRWSLFDAKHTDECLGTPKMAFANAWIQVHRSEPLHSWNANPWVWAITFSLHNPEIVHAIRSGDFYALPDVGANARGISFQDGLVRRILGGHKTQTRRLLRRFEGEPHRAKLREVRHGIARPA